MTWSPLCLRFCSSQSCLASKIKVAERAIKFLANNHFLLNLQKRHRTAGPIRLCHTKRCSVLEAEGSSSICCGHLQPLGPNSGEGNGNPLQYSCLEKSHGWRSLVGCSPWDRKESAMTERLHLGSSIQGDSPGKNTGVGSHALLQGIFLTQGLNLGLLHCRQILYHLSHKGQLFFKNQINLYF